MKKHDVVRRWFGAERQICHDIKVRVFGGNVDVAREFDCSEDCAAVAREFAWRRAQEEFWRQVHEEFDSGAFGFEGAAVEPGGRSDGWLVLRKYKPLDQWSAADLANWRKFCGWVDTLIEHLTSDAEVLQSIRDNCWHEEGAEYWNFVDVGDELKTVSGMKREAIAAGFGAVIRR